MREAPAHPGARMAAACRGFRRWSLSHPAEFGVAFGRAPATEPSSSDPRLVADDGAPAGSFVAAAFARIYADLWDMAPFDVRGDHELDPDFAADLRRCRAATGLDGLPLDAVRRFLGG